jgi:hypothetical protein
MSFLELKFYSDCSRLYRFIQPAIQFIAFLTPALSKEIVEHAGFPILRIDR